jgi:SAM-dependent methyltransferase
MDTYGQRILSTGVFTRDWEHLFNRYLFESRFRGLDKIVDLGPGRCSFTKIAPERILAIDNAPALVERYTAEGLNIQLGDAYDMPLADSSVDGVYSCWLLEHLDDPVRCVSEIRRVLRPGGYACLVVPSAESLLGGFYDDYTHIRPYTKASLVQVAQAAGFDDAHVQYLFWTKGFRRLIPFLGEERMMTALRISDTYARRLNLLNRRNLVLDLRNGAT